VNNVAASAIHHTGHLSENTKDIGKTTTDQVNKAEQRLVGLIVFARSKYLERGLVGEMEIGTTILGVIASVKCEIGDEDHADASGRRELEEEVVESKIASPRYESDESAKKDDANSMTEKFYAKLQSMATGSMDKILDTLEMRAHCWRDISFKQDVMINGGMTVEYEFMGCVNSVIIQFAARAGSLIKSYASRLEREAAIEAAKPNYLSDGEKIHDQALF
jgi:hypothetical protein